MIDVFPNIPRFDITFKDSSDFPPLEGVIISYADALEVTFQSPRNPRIAAAFDWADILLIKASS